MERNHIVPGLKEAAIVAMNNDDWTPVRTLLEATIAEDSVEYTQLQQIHVNSNIMKMACSRGFTELMSIFLNSGVEVNCVVDEETNTTMLHLAVHTSNLSLVKLLVNAGADIDCEMLNGDTPLICAVLEGHLEVAKYLISVGADINTCNKHSVVFRHNVVTEEKLQFLLDSGCDVSKGCSPFLYWVITSNLSIEYLKMLLDAGASVNGMDTAIPLHIAAELGNIPKMQLLLDYGADINATNKYGNTALHEAILRGNLKSVEFLIEHGSPIHSANNNKETPLLFSINRREFDIAMLLINSGTDLNLDLHDRVLNKGVRQMIRVDVIECLLEHGANVNEVYYNNTALQYLLFYSVYSNDRKLPVAKLLLIYGSNHYIEDRNGDTVLHWACETGDLELVEYLIDYGLNVDAKNRQGKKPIDIAKERGHTNIVEAIIEYHCNKYTIFD